MRRPASPWIFEKVRRTTIFRPSRTYWSVSGGLSRNSKYASSKTTTILSGRRDINLSILPCEIKAPVGLLGFAMKIRRVFGVIASRSEEHTSELQSRLHLVCRLLLEKKKNLKAKNA